MPNRRRRRLRIILRRVLPLAAAAFLLALVWPELHAWLLSSPAFRVTRIVVKGNHYMTPRELIELAGVRPGMPLLEVRPHEAAARLKGHSRIERAEVRYRFPRALRLEVRERLPVARIEMDGFRWISSDGALLDAVPGEAGQDLPIVLPPAGCRTAAGRVEEPCVREALRFLSELDVVDPALSRTVSIIDLTAARFARVHLDTLQTGLLYAKSDEWRPHVRVLPAVMADLGAAGIEGAVLDLRFRDQIVRRGGERVEDESGEEARDSTRPLLTAALKKARSD
jgi:cell division protein FtsQ